ncbi:MAG TPA: hypothetical protein VJY33_22545 [Isosphaeraceae bacterium]|nr:hypothetical protein [Isosphaeraceae bacterium]
MDAIASEAGALKGKVEGARSALAHAIAKANLTGDPLGPALEAMSESLGAQLALHEANAGHFRDASDRLDQQLAETIAQGELALETRRVAIVESLAPELAKLTMKNVRTWNWTATLKTGLTFGGVAVALALGVGLAGYGAGWQAGRNSAVSASGALAGAVHQAGPEAESALVNVVRANNLGEAWAKCQKSATTDKDGRRVCMMPMWADPQGQPKG